MSARQALRAALGGVMAAVTMVAGAIPAGATVEPAHRLDSVQRPNEALAGETADALRTGQGGSPLVAGALHDSAGQPLGGTSLRIDLEPAPSVISAAGVGVGLEYIKVDEARTAVDGTFAFTAPPFSGLRGYADEHGVVSALITSSDGQNSVWRRIYLQAPAEGNGRWRLAEPAPARKTVPDQLRKIDGSRSDVGVAAGNPGEDASSLRLVGHPPASSGKAPLGIPNPAQYCNSNEGYYFAMSDLPVKRSLVTVRAHATGPNTTATYAWSTTNTTQIEAAANIGAGGALAKAGFTNVQSNSAGINFEIGHYRPAHFQAEFEFRTWDLWCEHHITLEKRLSGKYEWRPYRFTGGNDIIPAGGNQGVCPDPDTVVPISSPTWVARDSTWTRYGGVDFSTVKLDSRTTNGENWKLTVTPVRSAHICGLEDVPVYASYVMEQY
ncbi:hypothetical protein [Nonomuraea basaltis]|uniref:hypothetical protein n=1 Tax=Nonomuraea basaltis TaxID=2495887 RepID=UPI00110C70B8|nr:hypothetical protein [Nonomuraea basaltis]TMR91643.1 hypothetical protein EJK15_48900 [Nonomuraea basaltis]